jgi:hypothetical protein
MSNVYHRKRPRKVERWETFMLYMIKGLKRLKNHIFSFRNTDIDCQKTTLVAVKPQEIQYCLRSSDENYPILLEHKHGNCLGNINMTSTFNRLINNSLVVN